ncbi:MAG: diguanylate cyclase [Rhodospirillales bacterium]|nr:diguanylate cyclase [Rhodospirillales bacterium]
MTVVYIVDDQSINLRILARFAQSLGDDVRVLTFDDPVRALAAFAADPPDLIVTDYVMPGMDGEAFISHCRQHPVADDAPIIVVTAYEDREFRYRALDTGATDYLLSPVDGREFCIRARNLLSLRRHQLAERERATALEGELESTLRRHAEAIRRKEEQLRRVVNTVPALISATDRDGVVCLLNSGYQQYGISLAPTATRLTMGDLFGETYGARHRAFDAQILAGGEAPGAFEEYVTDAAGEPRVLLTTKAPLTAGDATADGVVTVSLDITERKQHEQAVVESEQRFRALVEGSVLGILIERDRRPLFVNPMLARLFGYTDESEILAMDSVDTLFPEDERERIGQIRRTTLAGDTHGELTEFGGLRRDGTTIWLQAQAQRVSWKGKSAVQMTMADVSLRKAYELQLQQQANFDSLTGLPNRLLMMDRLRGAILSAGRHGHRGAVLFIDLDYFKKINDTLGHAAGDEVLQQAAERLTSCVRGEDTVSRIGGDEFTIILPNIETAANAEPVVQKILQAFAHPFLLSDLEAVVSASIGITVFPDDGNDPETLMKNADVAMYRSKERGRNTFEFFSESLSEHASEQIRIETSLRHALERNEISLCFQPIFDVRSTELVGAEAQVCWDNPDLGHVVPERYLTHAEETGLIVPIRAWALDEACRQWRYWHAAGLSLGRLVVDMSPGRKNDANLPEVVEAALGRHAIPPECLELGIGERSLLHRGDELANGLRGLASLGVQIAIDEFGAEDGPLTQIRDIPVAAIRIAAVFLSAALGDRRQARIMEAIVAMAHRLSIRVAAVGVNSEDHFQFALSCGCDLAQGLYFGQPLAAASFESWAWEQMASGRTTAAAVAGADGSRLLTRRAWPNASR